MIGSKVAPQEHLKEGIEIRHPETGQTTIIGIEDAVTADWRGGEYVRACGEFTEEEWVLLEEKLYKIGIRIPTSFEVSDISGIHIYNIQCFNCGEFIEFDVPDEVDFQVTVRRENVSTFCGPGEFSQEGTIGCPRCGGRTWFGI